MPPKKKSDIDRLSVADMPREDAADEIVDQPVEPESKIVVPEAGAVFCEYCGLPIEGDVAYIAGGSAAQKACKACFVQFLKKHELYNDMIKSGWRP